ncbi:MAG: hypothetical protein AB2A00_38580 [Myxococcota bacterium]
MSNRSALSAAIGGMALGAGLAAATLATAQQEPPGAVLVPQPTGPAGGAPRGLPPDMQRLYVTALAADTFVTVKDHGDSQTVSVFKIDAKGINHLTHKAKFFY